jgi:ribose-phosphate pyrophosphokinase
MTVGAGQGHRGRLSLVACESGRAFAARESENLVEIMRQEDGEAHPVIRQAREVQFANGEIKTVIEESLRGDDVYVIQCVDDPLSSRSVNDNFMALLTAINAVYQSDPDFITAVIPQFPYSRQERKKAREPITARLVAAALEGAGANRVLTLDIHAEAIEGFFQRAILEDLHASKEIIAFLRREVPTENLCVVAPDTAGAHMARFYANRLNCPFAVVDKARDYTRGSAIESMRLVGEVRGKRIILPDDMVATGGTLLNACRLLREKGATEIYAVCSHPFFNGNAVEKLDRAYHEEQLFKLIVGTDAVWRGEDFIRGHPWYREVSVAGLFARVIFNINRRRSVSDLLK